VSTFRGFGEFTQGIFVLWDVYACSPLSVFDEGNSGITKEVVDDELPLLLQAALEAACPAIDCNTPTKNLASYFPDKVHPSPEASKAIVQAIFRFFPKI
jgi:hypothetical protein